MATSLANPAASIAGDSEPAPSRPWIWRWLFPSLGVLSLLTSCLLWSSKKPLAGDELFSWVELRDPSFTHLLHAALHLGGAGMPLFYLTAWPWVHLFGLSDLSLRLYSCAGVCGAFVILCTALRRRYSAASAFLGVAFGLFASLIVVDQNVEARGYGLYLLLAAAAVAAWLPIAETAQPRKRDLVWLSLTQAGLVLGHVLALLYAGVFLAILVASDLWQGRFRTRIYLACTAGWLALLPWIPAIQSSMAVGKPHSWISVPGCADLAIGFSFWMFAAIYVPLFRAMPAGNALGWTCAMACLVPLIIASLISLRGASPKARALVLPGLGLVAAPILFFVVSRLVSPIYVPRYMIPSALGVALLATAWVQRANLRIRREILACALLVLPPLSAMLARPEPLDVSRISQLAGGRAVVCDWLQDFLVLTRYESGSARPLYVLDRRAALAGPAGAIGGFNLMQNYRSNGYLTGNLIDVSAVTAGPSFLVLDNRATNWFELRIQHNERWRWKIIANIDHEHRLIEVRLASQLRQPH